VVGEGLSGLRRWCGGLCVYCFAHRFAGFKVRHQFFRNDDLLAAARVAANARRAPVDGKAAEASDFDAVAVCQGITHGIENGLHCELSVALIQLRETFGQFIDEV
jgi:hypothetical protein